MPGRRRQRRPGEVAAAVRRRTARQVDAATAFADQTLPDSLTTRARRLRAAAVPIVQMAFAAAIAWVVAREVVGHGQPLFAPIAAVITLGVGYGQRLRRSLEIVAGVAIGILVGDLLVLQIGTGTVQLGVVVGLALAVAVFVADGPLFVNQAAVSAVLVVVLTPPTPGAELTYGRFLDALVGGGVALLTNVVLLPVNPVTVARRHVDPVLDELAGILTDLAAALARGDRATVSAALTRARSAHARVEELQDGLAGSAEVARLAPARWRSRSTLGGYLALGEPLDLAVRNARVVARTAVGVLRAEEPVPVDLPAAVEGIAHAVRLLRRELAERDEPVGTRRALVSSARAATDAVAGGAGPFGTALVVALRSLCVDLLVATGVEHDTAVAAIPDLAAPTTDAPA